MSADPIDPSIPAPSALQRLIAAFRRAMVDLGKPVTEAQLERWAVLIHASMSGRGRSYHTVEHVFQVNEGADALGTLAILFHDTVYCEVDGGLPRGLESHLSDALQVHDGHFELGPFDPDKDVLRALTVRLFGFTPGQTIHLQNGLNELSSALLAVRSLRSHLTDSELAQVVTCVEATIAFRDQGAEDRLAARLAEVDTQYSLGLGEEGVRRAVKRAVRVANNDIGNFAFEDTGAFLSHTWEILPETNPTLRMPAYTIGEYRTALGKMAGFFGSLTPERVFRQYCDTPLPDELARLRERANTNLARGTRYLRQKLLSARILQSLADHTGGDAPVSLFIGDLPTTSPPTGALRLNHVLPSVKPPTVTDVDAEVLRLLNEGRERESFFDLRHSPLAGFVYAEIGDAASDRALEQPDGWPLLSSIPASVVSRIAQACAKVAISREKALLDLAQQLGSAEQPTTRTGADSAAKAD